MSLNETAVYDAETQARLRDHAPELLTRFLWMLGFFEASLEEDIEYSQALADIMSDSKALVEKIIGKGKVS